MTRKLSIKRWFVASIVLLAVLSVALLDHAMGLLPVADDWHRYHEQRFEVLRVIDGDTIVLRTPDGDRATTVVRLWAVDTPELDHDPAPHQPPDHEPGALAAAAYTRSLVEGRAVTLRLQRHRIRGGFGRVLAYVVLPDGRVLNELLIAQGHTEHEDRWSHDAIDTYEQIENRARDAGVGRWAE